MNEIRDLIFSIVLLFFWLILNSKPQYNLKFERRLNSSLVQIIYP